MIKVLKSYSGLAVFSVLLVAFFSFKSEHFFSAGTLISLLNQIPALTVIAVGMTFVLIIAGIDLSVGSVLALAGSVIGVAIVDWGWSLAAAVGLALLVGALCGTVNGAITVKWAIPSFIVTLGMLEIARGGAYLVTGSSTKYIGNSVEGVATPIGVLGLSPAFVIAVLVVVFGQLVLSKTIWGRYALAIGAGESVVVYSGINPRTVKIGVFAMSGMLSGLGALFYASRLGSADPNAGIGLELQAIAAVVIGGTSLMGGRGSVVRSFIGVLIIAILETGLAQIGASEPTKRLITGFVIVIAVVADVYRVRLAAKGEKKLEIRS